MTNYKTSPPVNSANEATRCAFIEPIIRGVAPTFGGKVIVYSEYEVCGGYGKGPIDWVIKVDDTIICC